MRLRDVKAEVRLKPVIHYAHAGHVPTHKYKCSCFYLKKDTRKSMIIFQEASGSIRVVDGSSVMVMRGSYEYVGADGQTYVVDWSADETGFHPSAPHLPQPVEIPFADQAAAVAAQIRFAQQQQEEEQQLLRDQIGQSLEDLPTYGALTSSSVLPAFS